MARKRKSAGRLQKIRGGGHGGDRGTAERYRHGDVIELEETMQAGIVRARNLTQTALDRYSLRREINERQYDAGNRLYHQWRASGSQVSVTGRYGLRLGHSPELSELQMDMRRRVDRALRAVGRQLAGVLVHVCLTDQPARDWAVGVGGPPQAGILVLRLALDALADVYEKGRAAPAASAGDLGEIASVK